MSLPGVDKANLTCYLLQNIFRIIKQMRIRWMGHLARIDKIELLINL